MTLAFGEDGTMNSIRVEGNIDDEHRLSAVVPVSVPAGPVTVWIGAPQEEDDAGAAWMSGIVSEWADDLADARQDIYSLGDGEPIDPAQ
jgi:hypothetical protein